MKKVFFLYLIMICITCSLASAQVISGTYAIKNDQTGMLLRIKDANSKNGTPLVLYNPENWKCMTWDFKNISGNTYQLQNLFTHKSFQTVANPGTDVAMEQQPFKNGDAAQLYEFEAIGKGSFLIRLKGSDLYLTPSDKEGSVNSVIILSKRTKDKLQLWSIYQQTPTM